MSIILNKLSFPRFRLSPARLAFAALALATTVGVLQAPSARLLPSNAPITTAALFTLSIWLGSAVCRLALCLASSVDRLSELALWSARSAVAAAWVAPGLLLLAVATPLTIPAGFALIVAGVWLTFSIRTPNRWKPANPNGSVRSVRHSLLTAASVSQGFLSAQSAPVAVAAVIAHLAVVAAVFARSPLLGALLAAFGAGVAALAPASRRTATPAGWRKAAFTLAAAVALASLTFQPQTATSRRKTSLWASLIHTAAPEQARKQANVTPLIPLPARVGKELIPGVVLRPGASRNGVRGRDAVLPSLHPGAVLTVNSPLTLQFTGEYELFPEANPGITADASVLRGTPLDAVYGTIAHGALTTQAVQRFRPWLDCSKCSRIRLVLVHGDRSPGLATAYIESDHGTEEVGSDLYGWGAEVEENIAIEVPPKVRRSHVFALRIAFRPLDPSERSKSVRVAIRRLVWEPMSE